MDVCQHQTYTNCSTPNFPAVSFHIVQVEVFNIRFNSTTQLSNGHQVNTVCRALSSHPNQLTLGDPFPQSRSLCDWTSLEWPSPVHPTAYAQYKRHALIIFSLPYVRLHVTDVHRHKLWQMHSDTSHWHTMSHAMDTVISSAALQWDSLHQLWTEPPPILQESSLGGAMSLPPSARGPLYL